jgi:hypothetical protein
MEVRWANKPKAVAAEPKAVFAMKEVLVEARTTKEV